MYYGNSVCSSQEFPEKVWNLDYIMVHHMDGSQWSNIDDSTINNNDVTGTYQTSNPGYNAIGKIGKCVDFNGNCMLLLPASSSYSNLSDVTLECWVEPHDLDNYFCGLICKRYDDYWYTGQEGWTFWIQRNPSSTLRYKNYRPPGVDSSGISQFSEGSWYYVAVTIDNTGNLEFYRDGYLDGTDIVQDYPPDNANYLTIGGWDINNNLLSDGKIDEVRISKIVRSGEWISTSYNNQNNNLGFLSFGSEETGP
jgi:hypothetical protein